MHSKKPAECSSSKNEILFLIYGFVLSIKCLLIRCYHSTDFEVHRNWMAITYHLPMSEWYHSDLSEWTIDYPPFFSYFEYCLSKLASMLDVNMLVLQKDAYLSENVVLFQRFSVIALDVFYALSALFVSRNLVQTMPWKRPRVRYNIENGLFLLLLANPALILLDNMHFQYNSAMYSLLFVSIGCVLAKRYLLGAFSFSILLNFKHIFLYYVPAFTMFYAINFLMSSFDRQLLRRTVLLGFAVILPLLLSFGPFLFIGGVKEIDQILQRLFPFKRGLTHAYWAPNFWALYNSLDFTAYKLSFVPTVRRRIFDDNFTPQVPQYTRGLVMEYSHSVLPNLNPVITLSLTIFFCLPILGVFLCHKASDAGGKFLTSLTLSAFSFFFFGWHVHEKAILMVFFPMLLLAFKDLRLLSAFHWLCLSTVFSCFPLFFTPLENLLKFGLGTTYLILHVGVIFHIFKLSKCIIPKLQVIYFVALVIAGLYESFLHRVIFGESAPFIPLAVFSLLCTIGVIISYAELLFMIFANNLHIWWLKLRCVAREKRIIRIDKPGACVEPISLIAGVDISACVDEPNLAIASITVLNAVDRSIVEMADEVILLPQPYIPEYLAVREAPVMADLINSFLSRTKLKVDVLFVDGNGSFHSRSCGLASHVGYLTNLRSVGVAKTFNGFPLQAMGCSQSETDKLEANVKRLCRETRALAVAEISVADRAVLNILIQAKPLFISGGFNLGLEDSTSLSVKFASNTITNSIRLSDLRSRALLQEFYG